MNKKFDCVKMKRKGAEILREKIKGMTLEEELKFWQERNKEFRKEKIKKTKEKVFS